MKKTAQIKILEAIIKNKGKTFTEVANIAMLHPCTVKRNMTKLFNACFVVVEGFKQNRNGKSRRYGITTKGTIELMPSPSSVRPGICKSEIHEIARLNKSLKAQDMQIESIIESAKQNGRFGAFINQFI